MRLRTNENQAAAKERTFVADMTLAPSVEATATYGRRALTPRSQHLPMLDVEAGEEPAFRCPVNPYAQVA